MASWPSSTPTVTGRCARQRSLPGPGQEAPLSCSIGAPVGLEVQAAGGLPAVRSEGHDLLVVPGVRLFDDLPVADVHPDVSGVAVADLGEHAVSYTHLTLPTKRK